MQMYIQHKSSRKIITILTRISELTPSIRVKFFYQRECLLKKTSKISKNYNKIHENSKVTDKIMKNIHVLTYEYK